uniref:Uncharacterized protein n=1 Tax=Salmo trutta TaxID=8032 RepID=A0A673ZV21_SALTR
RETCTSPSCSKAPPQHDAATPCASWLGWCSLACKPLPFSSKHNDGHYGQTVLFFAVANLSLAFLWRFWSSGFFLAERPFRLGRYRTCFTVDIDTFVYVNLCKLIKCMYTSDFNCMYFVGLQCFSQLPHWTCVKNLHVHIPIRVAYPRPIGYPYPRPIGYPYPRPIGYPYPRPIGYPYPRPIGYPYPRPIGYPYPRPIGYPYPRPIGYPYPRPIGYPYPRPIGYPYPRPIGYPYPRPIGYPYPRPMGYPYPRPMGYTQLRLVHY